MIGFTHGERQKQTFTAYYFLLCMCPFIKGEEWCLWKDVNLICSRCKNDGAALKIKYGNSN